MKIRRKNGDFGVNLGKPFKPVPNKLEFRF